MREKVTGILLTGLEKHTPPRIRSIQLQILLNATAAAFGQAEKGTAPNTAEAAGTAGQQAKLSPRPRIWHLPQEEALAAYASYTTACLSCLSESEIDKKQIFQSAYRLGRRIRKMTGFSRQEDLERLVFYLYSNIGIEMAGHLPGEILIPVCYFSKVYTPDQCRTMSLMDWGIISGICGGGKLRFSERLTQGCGRCRAQLTQKSPE